MKVYYSLAICVLAFTNLACQKNITSSIPMTTLPKNLVIAHRGTTYWAPEETEAAMRWARNIGAHYLEFDLQRTKDGYLIALHDEKLTRTTNIAQKFPDRKDQPVSNFNYEELLSLDVGSWFNQTNPDRSRASFVGLDILTLEDVIQIAEGNRIKRNADGKRMLIKSKTGRISSIYEPDPADNGNRPGIYPETKVPDLFPGIEENLLNELIQFGWYHVDVEKLKPVEIKDTNKVKIANSANRVILQTFSKKSLATLQSTFHRPIPTCFLLWRGNDPDDLPNDSLNTFKEWIDYGRNHGATIIGPSIAGAPNNYADLLNPERAAIIRKANLSIHAYSFDTQSQLNKYATYVDGMFSNRADDALAYYRRKTKYKYISASDMLDKLGY